MSENEKIKNSHHIFLIGLSGSGKSSLGRAAAQQLSIPFIDLDLEIERRAGLSIREIFRQYGETYFRDTETAVLKDIVINKTIALVATGGGAPMRQESADALRENGFVIFIDRPPENIAADIACDGSRPLITEADDIVRLAVQRYPIYKKTAHVTLQNNADFDQVLQHLVNVINSKMDRKGFAVIGDPIGHTLSPKIHNAVFHALGIDAQYYAQHVPRGQLGVFAEQTRTNKINGFNVTIPHKQDIIPFLDKVEGDARLCNAVNTVVVRENKLIGYNTDMNGLLLSLQQAGYAYKNAKILILGAGGAASGIAFKAALEGAKEIIILNRDATNSKAVAERIRMSLPAAKITYGQLTPETAANAARSTDILINATPLGMHGATVDFSGLDFLNALPAHALVNDLIYNPSLTRLLKHAQALGLATQNGLGMLIFQALLADELFLGQTLDKDELFKIIKGVLQS